MLLNISLCRTKPNRTGISTEKLKTELVVGHVLLDINMTFMVKSFQYNPLSRVIYIQYNNLSNTSNITICQKWILIFILSLLSISRDLYKHKNASPLCFIRLFTNYFQIFDKSMPSARCELCSVSSPLPPPLCLGEKPAGHFLYKLETASDAQRKTSQNSDLSIRQIQHFLQPQAEVEMDHYLLSPKVLLRYAPLLDIVRPTCRRSVCFTRG